MRASPLPTSRSYQPNVADHATLTAVERSRARTPPPGRRRCRSRPPRTGRGAAWSEDRRRDRPGYRRTCRYRSPNGRGGRRRWAPDRVRRVRKAERARAARSNPEAPKAPRTPVRAGVSSSSISVSGTVTATITPHPAPGGNPLAPAADALFRRRQASPLRGDLEDDGAFGRRCARRHGALTHEYPHRIACATIRLPFLVPAHNI